MFCPQCGNSRLSADVIYCSGCGFPLGGVQRLVANGGVLPSPPEAVESIGSQTHLDLSPSDGADAALLSPRRRGINRGLLLWMIGAVVVPLSAVLAHTLGFSPALTLALAILLFVGGLMRMLYALLIQEGGRGTGERVTDVNPSPVHAPALAAPPASLPASSAASFVRFERRTTAELVPPPSVTEHTTRLLDRERQP